MRDGNGKRLNESNFMFNQSVENAIRGCTDEK